MTRVLASLTLAGMLLGILLVVSIAPGARFPVPGSAAQADRLVPLGRDCATTEPPLSSPDPARRTRAPEPVLATTTVPGAVVVVPSPPGTISGIASFVGPRFGPRYLALPEGRGITVRICGPAACVVRTSTDAGPDLAMQRAGRIADASFADFASLCSCDPWAVGLVAVTVTRVPAPPQTASEPAAEP